MYNNKILYTLCRAFMVDEVAFECTKIRHNRVIFSFKMFRGSLP